MDGVVSVPLQLRPAPLPPLQSPEQLQEDERRSKRVHHVATVCVCTLTLLMSLGLVVTNALLVFLTLAGGLLAVGLLALCRRFPWGPLLPLGAAVGVLVFLVSPAQALLWLSLLGLTAWALEAAEGAGAGGDLERVAPAAVLSCTAAMALGTASAAALLAYTWAAAVGLSLGADVRAWHVLAGAPCLLALAGHLWATGRRHWGLLVVATITVTSSRGLAGFALRGAPYALGTALVGVVLLFLEPALGLCVVVAGLLAAGRLFALAPRRVSTLVLGREGLPFAVSSMAAVGAAVYLHVAVGQFLAAFLCLLVAVFMMRAVPTEMPYMLR